MSVPTKLADVKVSSSEVIKWLRDKKLTRTKANVSRATNTLRAQKQKDALPLGRDVAINVQNGPRHVIYGECRIGGQFVFLGSRNKNQYFDTVVAFAGHEINAVTKLFLDDCEVVWNSGLSGWSKELKKPDGTIVPALNKIYMQVNTGSDSQPALSELIANNPARWTSAHRGLGVAHAYIMFVWDATLWGDGLPEITFQVQGKKVRDPRTGTTYYTNNAALIQADYITDSRIGLGSSVARLDDASLSDAANVCDELVLLKDGTYEKRYTINGYFTLDETPGRILERMASATGGNITYTNGKWKFWPAKYRSPTINITEDDLRGPIKIQTLAARDEIFNSVRGTFVSASKGFIETDWAPIWNENYRSQDGDVIWEDIDFSFVTSEATCARLGKIELERVRQGIQVDVDVSLKGFLVQVPETVSLTYARYGWDAKEFEVVRCDLVVQSSNNVAPEIIVSLSLRETASGVYNWNYWEATIGDAAPNTELPSPYTVATPVGLTLSSGTSDLYLRGDGVVAPRIKVSWSAMDDFFVSSGGNVEIQFRISGSSIWLDALSVPGNSSVSYLIDVQDGINYDVRIRAVNAFRVASAWIEAFNFFVVGKTALPSNVTGFAANVSEVGIRLAWTAIPDVDADLYEIREGASWTSPSRTWQVRGTSLQSDMRAVGTSNFSIKAIDTTGNYSSVESIASVVISPPIVVSSLASFNGPDCIISWSLTLGSWPLDGYLISFGDVYANSTALGFTKSTRFSTKANWSGVRRFWVQPRDTYQNLGSAIAIDVTLISLSAVTTLAARIIDNTVFLTWGAPTSGSLPVDYYKIYKGSSFAGATLIGQTATTFTTLTELISGTFTYWVVPHDTAGNAGTPLSVTTQVDRAPDFTLVTNQTLNLSSASTLTNCLLEPDGTILLPVNTSETWASHFTSRSWSTPGDQVAAGYPIFIQPTPSTAQYIQTIDVGTLISAGALVAANVQATDISGSITLTPTISVSSDNVVWRDYAGTYSVFESNFRYIKLKLDASGGGTALKRINSVTITASVKLKRDSGSFTMLAKDSAGTQQNFALSFYDIVGAPQITPLDILRAPVFSGGNSNYLSVADNTDFEPGTGDFSINLWVYFNGGLQNASVSLVNKQQTVNQFEYSIFYDASLNRLRFLASPDGISQTNIVTANNFGAISTNIWLNVTAYHNSVNDKIGIRVNKTVANELAYSSNVFASTSRFQVGSNNIDPGTGALALLKNLAIWKGRVLSSSDMDTLFDSGFEKYSNWSSGLKTNIIGMWEMNEASGNRASSVGSHTLVQTGTVSSRILPQIPIADFADIANPTNFKGYMFTESQVRVTGRASWYVDGYAAFG